MPIDLNMSWYSDLKTTPFNFTGYQNRNVDKIIDELKITRDENMKNLLLREVQEILHNDEYFTDFNLKLPSDIPGKQRKFNSYNYSTLEGYRTTFDLRTIRNIIIKHADFLMPGTIINIQP